MPEPTTLSPSAVPSSALELGPKSLPTTASPTPSALANTRQTSSPTQEPTRRNQTQLPQVQGSVDHHAPTASSAPPAAHLNVRGAASRSSSNRLPANPPPAGAELVGGSASSPQPLAYHSPSTASGAVSAPTPIINGQGSTAVSSPHRGAANVQLTQARQSTARVEDAGIERMGQMSENESVRPGGSLSSSEVVPLATSPPLGPPAVRHVRETIPPAANVQFHSQPPPEANNAGQAEATASPPTSLIGHVPPSAPRAPVPARRAAQAASSPAPAPSTVGAPSEVISSAPSGFSLPRPSAAAPSAAGLGPEHSVRPSSARPSRRVPGGSVQAPTRHSQPHAGSDSQSAAVPEPLANLNPEPSSPPAQAPTFTPLNRALPASSAGKPSSTRHTNPPASPAPVRNLASATPMSSRTTLETPPGTGHTREPSAELSPAHPTLHMPPSPAPVVATSNTQSLGRAQFSPPVPSGTSVHPGGQIRRTEVPRPGDTQEAASSPSAPLAARLNPQQATHESQANSQHEPSAESASGLLESSPAAPPSASAAHPNSSDPQPILIPPSFSSPSSDHPDSQGAILSTDNDLHPSASAAQTSKSTRPDDSSQAAALPPAPALPAQENSTRPNIQASSPSAPVPPTPSLASVRPDLLDSEPSSAAPQHATRQPSVRRMPAPRNSQARIRSVPSAPLVPEAGSPPSATYSNPQLAAASGSSEASAPPRGEDSSFATPTPASSHARSNAQSSSTSSAPRSPQSSGAASGLSAHPREDSNSAATTAASPHARSNAQRSSNSSAPRAQSNGAISGSPEASAPPREDSSSAASTAASPHARSNAQRSSNSSAPRSAQSSGQNGGTAQSHPTSTDVENGESPQGRGITGQENGRREGNRRQINPPEVRDRRDIVIILLGSSGAGMSTFINETPTKFKTPCAVSDSSSMKPCTKNLEVVELASNYTKQYRKLEGRKVKLIDTLGLDSDQNGAVTDKQTFMQIAEWLKKNDVVVGRIVFLYKITEPSFGDQARRAKNALSEMCGLNEMSRVVLATSKWSELSKEHVDSGAGERKEKIKLMRWKRDGADGKSARDIVDCILKELNDQFGRGEHIEPLQIQKEVSRTDVELPHKKDRGCGLFCC
ncbi:hypothetical protein DFP72DRAFT_910738 [Ephemerocybe angulata]|uniref:Uncharacterized protein n=1 Tax=Ephemerocybe angulata TaxID=980116 RepID=A0A8H6HQ47_9AGAR|nr:hypothetical protein DFP72DRAFT_910738 [Tulosesus angulatus]